MDDLKDCRCSLNCCVASLSEPYIFIFLVLAISMDYRHLSKEVFAIQKRNRRVEADKAWERSYTRRALLAIFTYIAIAVYLFAVKIPDPFITAIVPTVGFMLSTLTMPFFKNLWLSRVYNG